MSSTMTYADYAALPGVRFSDLCRMATSPLHFAARADGDAQTDTPAMAMGRAIHCAVLEPDAFARQYTRRPEEFHDGRSKAAKEWKAETEASGRIVLGSSDWHRVERCARAVHSDPIACRYLRAGQAEQVLRWEQPDGRKCKARLDWVGTAADGTAVVVDLKTTRTQSLRQFAASAANYHYHAQLAWYLDGLAAEHGATARIITVSTLAPYDVVVYRLPPDVLAHGQDLIAEWLRDLEACEQSDTWPGIAEGVERDLTLPTWAMPGDDADDLAGLNLDAEGLS
uniref:Putative exodeoxyribonuclease 8 PDDEXK-like domain-containing protein n=1 Tax=viral metagenome TaxID=1070528 RepID=A0A6M3J3Y5_9ZZZZ